MGMQPMKEAVTIIRGFVAVRQKKQPNKVWEMILIRQIYERIFKKKSE